jgi:transposase
MTTAPQNEHDNAHAPVLFLACELRENTWQLGCTLGHGQPPRARPMAARDTQRLRHEVAQATVRCGLGATAPVGSGEAAGRAGCWLPRFWQVQGLTHPGVDASSMEVKRRTRRAQSAALDVRQLVRLRLRYEHGARHVGCGVTVPSGDAEEPRQRPRALEPLQQERARTTNRLTGVLRSQGGRRPSVPQRPAPLDALRLWAGAPVPRGLRRR